MQSLVVETKTDPGLENDESNGGRGLFTAPPRARIAGERQIGRGDSRRHSRIPFLLTSTLTLREKGQFITAYGQAQHVTSFRGSECSSLSSGRGPPACRVGCGAGRG